MSSFCEVGGPGRYIFLVVWLLIWWFHLRGYV